MPFVSPTSPTRLRSAPPWATTASAPRHQRLALHTEWLDAEQVRITALGDIDAGNEAQLSEYVFRRGANSRRLILDLQDVNFFSIGAMSSLRTIEFRCMKADVDLEVIPGQAVSRVLQLCGPNGSFRYPAA